MNQIKFLLHYFFNRAPGQEFKYYIPLLILAALLIIGSIIVSMIYKNRKKHDFAFKRLFKNLGRTLGLMGLLFLFLIAVRYENIPYFSMRLWTYLSVLLLLFLAYRYVKKFRIDYPREKENVHNMLKKAETKENKYLPNKKRK